MESGLTSKQNSASEHNKAPEEKEEIFELEDEFVAAFAEKTKEEQGTPFKKKAFIAIMVFLQVEMLMLPVSDLFRNYGNHEENLIENKENSDSNYVFEPKKNKLVSVFPKFKAKPEKKYLVVYASPYIKILK